MSRKLYVNIAVKDVQASIAFFTELGFTFDPQFTDEHAASMIVNDDTAFMLLDHGRFADFTKKSIVDSTTGTEAIFAIGAGSRQEVDDLVEAAFRAGAGPADDKQDHGFMYGWSFQDLDGHIWEVMYMDTAAFAELQQQA
ncbi:VOC family protein [Pseudonocardia nigra]|uniref:VOC family protein n=1 Tax=Pseudonocardia nigra TaxID=1921578 RepID=UPI001C5D2D90|nr:VOC family protein [Pseudonocardia nigra]